MQDPSSTVPTTSQWQPASHEAPTVPAAPAPAASVPPPVASSTFNQQVAQFASDHGIPEATAPQASEAPPPAHVETAPPAYNEPAPPAPAHEPAPAAAPAPPPQQTWDAQWLDTISLSFLRSIRFPVNLFANCLGNHLPPIPNPRPLTCPRPTTQCPAMWLPLSLPKGTLARQRTCGTRSPRSRLRPRSHPSPCFHGRGGSHPRQGRLSRSRGRSLHPQVRLD